MELKKEGKNFKVWKNRKQANHNSLNKCFNNYRMKVLI